MNDREQFEAWYADWATQDGFGAESTKGQMFMAWSAARATPAQPVGYVLFTGHGDKFSREKPKCEIDYWKPVYLESSQPSPSSVGAAIRALPLPDLPARARLYTSGLGQRQYRRASTMNGPGDPLILKSEACEAMRALLSEAAALAEQVQGQPVPEGWQLVPKEPTPEMIAAFAFRGDVEMAIGHAAIYEEACEDYTEMLAAAPSIAQDGQKSEGA